MIYVSAVYANAEETEVIGTDAEGRTEQRKVSDPHEFRRQDEFLTGFLSEGGVIGPYVEPEPVPQSQALGPISAAALSISGGEVLGIETSVNFGAAFMIDTDKYWVFFMRPEEDTNYLVLANVPFVKSTEYIEITAADLTEVSLTTWRVK